MPPLSEAGSDEGDAYQYDFDDDAPLADDELRKLDAHLRQPAGGERSAHGRRLWHLVRW